MEKGERQSAEGPAIEAVQLDVSARACGNEKPLTVDGELIKTSRVVGLARKQEAVSVEQIDAPAK